MSASRLVSVLHTLRSARRVALAAGPRSSGLMAVRMASGATPVSRKALRRMNEAFDSSEPFGPDQFKRLARDFLDQVQKAVEPMKRKNAGFTVTRTEDRLDIDLGDGKGTYMFALDEEVSNITLQSPMSGAQQYRYDTDTKQWVSTSDDHDVRGLLTRDLIRQCVGYPEFP